MADRVDVGAIRRAQIVEAASRVIARKGFHHATLAEVEAEAGISRGMMTYHFPTKDAMIQGVFETTIERLRAAIPAPDRKLRGMVRIDRIIDNALADGSTDGEFFCLHATFLAQAMHRADYRASLAALDASVWDALARDLSEAGIATENARSFAVILSAALFDDWPPRSTCQPPWLRSTGRGPSAQATGSFFRTKQREMRPLGLTRCVRVPTAVRSA